MSNTVRFTIAGDVDAAVAALGKFHDRLDSIARHGAFRAINQQIGQSALIWGNINRTMQATVNRLTSIGQGLANVARSGQNAANYMQQTASGTAAAANAGQRLAAQTQRGAAAARQMQYAWRAAGETIERVVALAARGLTYGTASLRGGATSIAGSVQQLGIGTRMSGIALGQQLSGIFSGSLSGNILSPLIEGLRNAINTSAGILTIGVELGTRIVTSIGGGIVKAGGLILGGAIQTAFALAAGVVSAGGKGLFGAATLGLLGVGAALNNIVSSAATIAGEVVGQVGNVLTGLGEVFRGAFQAAVNIAGTVLNSLVTIAQEVVGAVGGVLGTVGKAAFGTAGVLGGFAARDILKGESGLAKGLVLLDPSVTPEQRNVLRQWVFNVNREFGNLSAEQPGLALERIISTGFQTRPELATKVAEGALRLTSATGEEQAGEAARAMAKIMLVFRDEVSAEAAKTGSDIGTVLADKIFAVKNFGDIDIPQITARIGDLTGPARQANMSLNDLLTTLAQLTLVQGVEQSFTGLAQMLETFKKLGPEGREVLKEAGIDYKSLGGADKARKNALEAERTGLEKQIKGLDGLKRQRRDLMLQSRQERLDGKDNTRTKQQILDIDKRIAQVRDQGSSGRLKVVDEEIDRIDRLKGTMRPLLDIYRDLLQAVESGRLSEFELQKIIPNIRALRSTLGLDLLQRISPGEAEQVRAGITNSAGSVANAEKIRAEDPGFKLGQVLKELKQPFITFWTSQREEVLKFIDTMLGGLRTMNTFVEQALASPGFEKFTQNLSDKIGGLGESLFGGLNGEITPESFWAAMNAGLDTAWSIGERVVTTFTTLGGLIADIAGNSTGFQTVFSALKDGAMAVGGVVDALSKGDTGPLKSAFAGLGEVWEDLKRGAQVFAGEVASKIVQGVNTIASALDALITKFSSLAEKFALGAIGFGVGRYAQGALGGRGGGAGGPGVAGGILGAQALGGAGGGAVGGPGGGGIIDPVMALLLFGSGGIGQRGQAPSAQGLTAQQRAWVAAGLHGASPSLARSRALSAVLPPGYRPGSGSGQYRRTFTGAFAGLAGRGVRAGGRGLNAMLPFLLAYGASQMGGNDGSTFNSLDVSDPSGWGMVGQAGGGALMGWQMGGPGGALLGGSAGLLHGASDHRAAAQRAAAARSQRAQMAGIQAGLIDNPNRVYRDGRLIDPSFGLTGGAKDDVSRLSQQINEMQRIQFDPNNTDIGRATAAQSVAMFQAMLDGILTQVSESKRAADAQERIATALTDANAADELITRLAEEFPDDTILQALTSAIENLKNALEAGTKSPAEVAAHAKRMAALAEKRAFTPDRQKAALQAKFAAAPGLRGRLDPATGKPDEAMQEIMKQYAAAGGSLPGNWKEMAMGPSGFFVPFVPGGNGALSFTVPAPMKGKAGDKWMPGTKHGEVKGPGGSGGADPFNLSKMMKQDQQGHYYLQFPDGSRHDFPYLSKGPFQNAAAGTFGNVPQWAMSKDIGSRVGLGGGFRSAGSNGKWEVDTPLFGVRDGSGGFGSGFRFNGGGVADMVRGNQTALSGKLTAQADKMQNAANTFKEAGDGETAAKFEQAAETFRQAAEKASANAKNATKSLQDMAATAAKGQKEQSDLTQQGLTALSTMVDQLAAENAELRETVAALQSQVDDIGKK